MNISISKPVIGKKEKELVEKCVESGWVSVSSYWVEDFENKFLEVVFPEKKDEFFAVAVNSGTSALHLALVALGVGEGDEVIIPDFSMIAVANAVSYVGADPVLVSVVSEDNWNMDLDLLKKAYTKKTRAIIPVHTYGYSVDMKELMNWAEKRDVKVVEDAAEGLGGNFGGIPLGFWGDLGTYSFYPNKIVTTGEGGMVVGKKSSGLEEFLRRARHHFFGVERHFVHEKIGYSYGMSGMEAALGLAQLERWEDTIRRKQEIHRFYKQNLCSDVFELGMKVEKGSEPLYWMNCLVFDKEDWTDSLADFLREKGVETRSFFLPVSSQESYEGCRLVGNKKMVCELFNRGLILPSGPCINDKELEYVVDLVHEFIRRKKDV